ncbi:hypothetical protein Poli38472_000014 [Pythium oligandrum]|uniref:Vesicle transport protein n=1 Tax=Pythium oligandrum TaxID=41045 RepID=A0A8K1FHP7_PYTOL|nr:hypothetical protein Poli38472_000014 [Pythium oligandrum]|eukprot:TMW59972.1 hypothetical protein Poli38472_000014 [Pythium oligandrum]
MLEQLKAKSAQTAALAKEKAAALNVQASLKDVTQKGSQVLQSGSQAIQSQAKSAAKSLNITIPTRVASTASTASESDLESNKMENSPKNQEEEGLLDDFTQQCQLTKRQRLYGAIGCYVFGALCGLLSTLMMWGGPKHVKQFAFFYTVGNLSSIGSSLFLVGPARQLKVMCMPVRRVACCIWIGAMVLTLIIAFGFPKAGPLIMVLVIIQYVAMLWYGASFVPYGRTILKKCTSKAAGQVNSAI